MTPDVAIGISGSTFVAWRAPRWRGRNVGDVESTSRKAALSGDGRVCAVLPYSTDVLRTFSLESGREVPITLDPVYRTETAALALSPTGTSAALATYAGAITIADLEDQTTRLLRAASGDTISVLAISGDETRLVAGTAGGRLELWDLERGAQEALFCGGEAWAAAWVSHRADRIVAGDALGGVHFLVHDS